MKTLVGLLVAAMATSAWAQDPLAGHGARREARDSGTPFRAEPDPPPAVEVPRPDPRGESQRQDVVTPPPPSGSGSGRPRRDSSSGGGPAVTPWRDSSGPALRDGPAVDPGPLITPDIPPRPDSDNPVIGPPQHRYRRDAGGWVERQPATVPGPAENAGDHGYREYEAPHSAPIWAEQHQEPDTPSRRARRVAGRLARERLKRVSPGEAQFLERLTGFEVIVVPGRMDHLEEVLDNASIPYRTVFADTFARAPLNPIRDIVMVNCPGEGFSEVGLKRLRDFVSAGGWLVTTDWALRTVIERGFPGKIRAAPRDTDEESVGIVMQDTSHPFLFGIFDPGRPPRWSLDLDSFPIQLVKPRQVRVLLQSPDMKAKYGAEPVGVVFEWQRGMVFHLTSHFCMQRAPADGPLARQPATQYLEEEIAGPDVTEKIADAVRPELAGVTAAELDAHYTATKLIANVIVEHARRARAMGAPAR